MAVNFGLLPFLTHNSGRQTCCVAVPPLVGPTSVLIPNATQEWLGARAHLTRVRDSTILVQNRGS